MIGATDYAVWVFFFIIVARNKYHYLQYNLGYHFENLVFRD